MSSIWLICLAWLIETCVGWPEGLFKRIKHPVVWLAIPIQWFDCHLNISTYSHVTRYVLGCVSTLLTVITTTLIALAISLLLPNTHWGFFIEAAIASSLIASRSLYSHVENVLPHLIQKDIEQARKSVSMIVGRDPNQLNETAITRASIESLAENTSDGVIAPLFWGAIFGLPGIVAYKTINTFDSMIAHRSNKYLAYGGFAARLDDVANIIPARLTGFIFAFSSLKSRSFKVMFKDAPKHRSPNAGWPEAAIAGALNIRLSGPRTYNNQTNNEPWLNEKAEDPSPRHLKQGLSLYITSMIFTAFLLIVFAVSGEVL